MLTNDEYILADMDSRSGGLLTRKYTEEELTPGTRDVAGTPNNLTLTDLVVLQQDFGGASAPE